MWRRQPSCHFAPSTSSCDRPGFVWVSTLVHLDRCNHIKSHRTNRAQVNVPTSPNTSSAAAVAADVTSPRARLDAKLPTVQAPKARLPRKAERLSVCLTRTRYSTLRRAPPKQVSNSNSDEDRAIRPTQFHGHDSTKDLIRDQAQSSTRRRRAIWSLPSYLDPSVCAASDVPPGLSFLPNETCPILNRSTTWLQPIRNKTDATTQATCRAHGLSPIRDF